MNPKYPVYIPSKGRWESRLTAKALIKIGVPFRMVVEPQETEQYANVIPRGSILELPENFSDRGTGSIPARNWIWEHSISEGHDRHWIMDDNIHSFYRLNRNRRIMVSDGTILRCAEVFTDRYERVAFSGLEYDYFVPEYNPGTPPYRINTRIYSCILVNNVLPYRWRGRYNEDTDICLRALKDGWRTILFNAFLAKKMTTMMMSGGNTDTVYNTGDQRREFAESLARQHPDVVKVVWKWGRWHHLVDYSPFKKNKLERKPGVFVPQGVNDYGMKLVAISEAPALQAAE